MPLSTASTTATTNNHEARIDRLPSHVPGLICLVPQLTESLAKGMSYGESRMVKECPLGVWVKGDDVYWVAWVGREVTRTLHFTIQHSLTFPSNLVLVFISQLISISISLLPSPSRTHPLRSYTRWVSQQNSVRPHILLSLTSPSSGQSGRPAVPGRWHGRRARCRPRWCGGYR